MNRIAEYNDAKKQVKKLNALKDSHDKQCGAEIREIDWKYRDLKRDLDEKCMKETGVVEKRKEEYKNKIKSQLKPYYEIINDTETTYKLFEVLISDNSDMDFEYRFDRESPVIIDTPVDTQYLKVWVYIMGNNKPKNCFSLKIRVKSMFQWQFEEFRIDSRNIKDLPTEKELELWYEKNKNNLRWKWGVSFVYLPDILEAHADLEQKFEKARELWKQKSWQRAFWLHKKDYYENHYTSGTDTDEYKDICLLLKTAWINLPLLVGQIKSDMGKKELERRMKCY